MDKNEDKNKHQSVLSSSQVNILRSVFHVSSQNYTKASAVLTKSITDLHLFISILAFRHFLAPPLHFVSPALRTVSLLGLFFFSFFPACVSRQDAAPGLHLSCMSRLDTNSDFPMCVAAAD